MLDANNDRSLHPHTLAEQAVRDDAGWASAINPVGLLVDGWHGAGLMGHKARSARRVVGQSLTYMLGLHSAEVIHHAAGQTASTFTRSLFRGFSMKFRAQW